MLVAVTIPIYKAIPDEVEQISLTQCFKVLNKYPIVFYAPKSLNTEWYGNFCKALGEFSIETFEDHYFSGIKGYNKLMLSSTFYNRFLRYKFILIYQLDAFVFRDELEYWCYKGYDYIGAPYAFVNMDTYPIKFLTKFRKILKFFKRHFPASYTFKQVGNGGLSLRNVKKTIFLLQFKKSQPELWTIIMEDNFFQYWGNIMFLFFKLPDIEEAAKFSIELEPTKSYELIGKNLPFGCHAFMRYEKEFWLPFLQKEGYFLDK